MKQFISGLIVGIIIIFVLLNFGQIKSKFSKAYQETIAEHNRRPPANNAGSVQSSRSSAAQKKSNPAKNPNNGKPVSRLFQDIPQQIVDAKSTAEQNSEKGKTEAEISEKQPEPAVPGLLATLQEKGSLDYTEEYGITNEEQALYRRYKQLQQDYDRAINAPRLTMSQMKKYKSDYDDQLNQLASDYHISVNQLAEFEKYMKRGK